MGKGDIKSKRGKITNGSYGNARLRKKDTVVVASKPTEKVAKPKKEVAAKPAAKKSPAKKSTKAE
jgi:30S ribosomal protein S31